MSSIFSTSISDTLGPGVYGVNVKPPVTLTAVGTQTSAIVEQFPWGPTGVVYQPSSMADLILTFYPPGMNRNLPGPLAISGKGWPDLRIVRVFAATGTAAASATLVNGASNIVIVTLKSVGTAGNSVTVTSSASSDGNAAHFKLTVSVTGISGTTTDILDNLNVSGTGADYLGADKWANLRLVGTVTKGVAGTPSNQTVTCSGGTDGTVAATDYTGTLGLGDKGLALLEGRDEISFVSFGDPGTLRAACNAGMVAHVNANNRRIGFITGNAGQTASAAQTDVATYRSDNVMYIDPWMKQISDQDSTIQTIPAAAMAMSVASQVSPSTHISWRDSEIAKMLSVVYDVEAPRGNQVKSNSDAGICTLIKNKSGGFAFYTDNTSNVVNNPTQPDLGTIRIGIYVLASAEDGFASSVNGPNVPATQQPLRNALTRFMDNLVFNSAHDPAHNPYVKAYSLGDPAAANPQASLDAGSYSIPMTMKTDRGMIRIFIPITYGPTASP